MQILGVVESSLTKNYSCFSELGKIHENRSVFICVRWVDCGQKLAWMSISVMSAAALFQLSFFGEGTSLVKFQ